MGERNLEKDCIINQNQLEMESAQHADIYRYWSKKLAVAKEDRDRLKTSCKALEGQVELEYRTGTRKFPKGVDGSALKITESTITALVNCDTEVVALRDALDKQDGVVNLLQSAVDSIEQKGFSLNNLVSLYTKDYYQQIKNGENPDSVSNDRASDAIRKELNKDRIKKSVGGTDE